MKLTHTPVKGSVFEFKGFIKKFYVFSFTIIYVTCSPRSKHLKNKKPGQKSWNPDKDFEKDQKNRSIKSSFEYINVVFDGF